MSTISTCTSRSKSDLNPDPNPNPPPPPLFPSFELRCQNDTLKIVTLHSPLPPPTQFGLHRTKQTQTGRRSQRCGAFPVAYYYRSSSIKTSTSLLRVVIWSRGPLQVFMNTATLGASSELGSETSHEAKKLLGPAAYLVKGIARLAGYAAMPVKMRFPAPLESQQPHQKVAKEAAVGAASEGTADAAAAAAGAAATGTASEHQQQPPQPSTDQPHAVRSFSSLSGGRKNQVKGWLSSSWKKTVEVHEEVLNLTAGNSRQVASMLQACPDALLDDGLLDVTYVTGGAVESATALVGEILARGLDGAQPDNVRILRVPWIEVTLEAQDPDLTWPGNRDGEAVPPARKFLLEALPRRIAMHLPEESRELLTEGADPRVNAPVIAIDRMRKGAVRAMVAQVAGAEGYPAGLKSSGL
ncbi:hypothetical protein Vretifemale_7536 [Volvox reticuliferus]|nr:hypothetical protein Vretifemale_7536 [Volvox reticuliferus]